MTLRYAKIANRTVADEYFAVTEKVEALYDKPDRAARRRGRARDGPAAPRDHHRMLGNGYCTRPETLDCTFESDLRDLHLLPDQHRVPAHPASPTRPRRRTRPDQPQTSSPTCSTTSTRHQRHDHLDTDHPHNAAERAGCAALPQPALDQQGRPRSRAVRSGRCAADGAATFCCCGWLGSWGGRPAVLFIGGSGIISSACSRLAVERGIELYVLNRGRPRARPLPAEATVLQGDVRDPASVRDAVGDLEFDAVVDWLAFTPGARPGRPRSVPRAYRAVRLHQLRLGLPDTAGAAAVVESTPLRNPFWQYSRDKIACEELLVAAYREEGFPVTIVRPSHTYDKTLGARSTAAGRCWPGCGRASRSSSTATARRCGRSPTTTDFARGFVPLLGHPRTLGEAFHITSDDALDLEPDRRSLAAAAGVRAAHRARAVRRDRRRRPRLGRRPARRQGAFDGLRQRQAAPRRPRLRGHHPVRAGRAGDRRLARRGPGTATGRPHASTPSWTSSSRPTALARSDRHSHQRIRLHIRSCRDPRGPGGRFGGSARDRTSTPPTSRVLGQWLVRTFDKGGEPVERGPKPVGRSGPGSR